MSVNGRERHPPPDVVSSSQVREILGGISRSRLSQIVNDPRSGFPEHRDVPGAGYTPTRVWDRPAVIAWQQARTRPRRRMIYVLKMEHGKGRTIAQCAASAGVHRTTAEKWLRELGQIE